MIRRCFNILIYFTRLLVSTAIVPTALVAGMLSFPTTCQCGADQPHSHSIFEMRGHHHGPRTEDPKHDREVIRVGVDGVTAQAPTASATPTLAAVFATAVPVESLPRAGIAITTPSMPDGQQSTPEVPPPQA